MGYNRGTNKMNIKLYFVSLVLGGEVVSFVCCNPFAEVFKIAQSIEVSNTTIKNL